MLSKFVYEYSYFLNDNNKDTCIPSILERKMYILILDD